MAKRGERIEFKGDWDTYVLVGSGTKDDVIKRAREGDRFEMVPPWEPPPGVQRSIGWDDLKVGLMKLDSGSNTAALTWINTFGLWGGRNYSPVRFDDGIRRDRGVEPVNLMMFWWAEAMLLRRAIWLHEKLTTIEQFGNDFSSTCLALCEVRDSADVPDWGYVPRAYYDIRWPKEHTPREFSLFDCDGVYFGLFKDLTPEVYLWNVLAGMVDMAYRRTNSVASIAYDQTTGRVVEEPVTKYPSLAGACWEILRRRLLQERAPIKCKECGTLVKAKRSSKKFCNATCRKSWARKNKEAGSEHEEKF